MGTILGSGEFRYEVQDGWAQLPDGMNFKEVAAVGVDKADNVYCFTRGEHPMIVLDKDGRFLRTWGEGVFARAHGVTMGQDDTIFCTDDGDHTVRKCTLDGKVLMTLGVPGKAAAFQEGDPFNRCTHVAFSPQGDIYVSDGYGNSRVHKYSPDGKLLFSWGEPGTDPGQFNLVHNICTDRDGWVYVADRENHRIQVFDGKGRFETQWCDNLHRPCALYMENMDNGANPVCYIGELGPGTSQNSRLSEHRAPHRHPRRRWRGAGALRRSRHGRGAGTVHRAPRPLSGFAPEPLRGRGVLDHHGTAAETAAGDAQPAEACQAGLTVVCR